ncbi:MAG: hypothetical protein AB7L92_08970 [Alphaproteobacteria bacterium]
MSTSNYQPTTSYNLTATISSSGTTSGAIDLSGATLCGIILPAAITGTAISLQMSNDDSGTFVTVQDGAGSDLSLSVAASKYVPISNLALVAGLRFIKLVSNASEGAERVITLVTRAV